MDAVTEHAAQFLSLSVLRVSAHRGVPEFGCILHVSPMRASWKTHGGIRWFPVNRLYATVLVLGSTDCFILRPYPVVLDHSRFSGRHISCRGVQDVNDRIVRLCLDLLIAVHVICPLYHTTCTIILQFSGDTPTASCRVACAFWCWLLHALLLQATGETAV